MSDDAATGLSELLASLVERSGPSVVRVDGGRRGPSSGVAWSADGVVVTASHVLRRAEGIEVGLPDGRAVPGILVGRDPSTDVAALRVETAALAPAPWSEGLGLKVGHLVLAVSRPVGTARASLGIVAAQGGAWRTRLGGRVDRYLMTDVRPHPGFSGSLLIDVAGGALGFNTPALVRGMSLAVPTVTLRRVVESLLAHGQVRRGFLGVGTYSVLLPSSLQEALGQTHALLVVSVHPGSPAERAGLVLGDAVVSFDGRPTRQPADLLPLLEEERIGSRVAARIVRAGELREVSLVIGSRASAPAAPRG